MPTMFTAAWPAALGAIDVPPSQPSILLSPADPGTLGQAPQDWNTIAHVTALAQVKWAVFEADWTSFMNWVTVNVPGNGQVPITATFERNGQRLVVQSPDDTLQVISGQVTLTTGGVVSIDLLDTTPGSYATPPQDWTTTAQVSGLPQVKWAVFNPDFSATGPFVVENVPGGGQVPITATFTADAQILVVKSLDETVQAFSDPVDFTGAPPPPGGGNPTGTIDIVHRGQSNAFYAHDDGGPVMLAQTLADLTGLSVNMVSGYGDMLGAGRNTIHSGTFSYWDNPFNSADRWIDPAGNYASPPSGWANNGPMAECIAAIQALCSNDPNVPLVDLCLHWEFDLGMWEQDAIDAYAAARIEMENRVSGARAAKNSGRLIRLLAYCPYEGGEWGALGTMMDAWQAAQLTPSRNVFMACGNMMDGYKRTQWVPEGDPSHWGDNSAQRLYPRIAFRLARILYDRTLYTPTIDLGDCPTEGPRIGAIQRSGNSLNLTIAHDSGNALVAGAEGIDWSCFTYNSQGGGMVTASGGAITGASNIRVDFPSAPPSTGTERFYHCYEPYFRQRRIIRDNWHSVRPAKYANVRHVANVEFPLQRTIVGLPF